MTLESATSTLEERGIVWQGIGFAAIGAISVPLLWIYSEADHWSIGAYRLALTQLNWAFALAIALVIEGVRRMFETRTEIRRAARAKAIEKARQKDRRAIEKRLRSAYEKRGIEVPVDIIDEALADEN